MNASNQEKIIFLVFANDHNDQTRYLRQLDEEARQLRKILAKVEDEQAVSIVTDGPLRLNKYEILEDIIDNALPVAV